MENYGREGYPRILIKSNKKAALSSWHAVAFDCTPRQPEDYERWTVDQGLRESGRAADRKPSGNRPLRQIELRSGPDQMVPFCTWSCGLIVREVSGSARVWHTKGGFLTRRRKDPAFYCGVELLSAFKGMAGFFARHENNFEIFKRVPVCKKHDRP